MTDIERMQDEYVGLDQLEQEADREARHAWREKAEKLETENAKLREALREIAAVKHPSEPPNPYKQIARAALGKGGGDDQ